MFDFSFFQIALNFCNDILIYSVPYLLTIMFFPICLTIFYALFWLIRHIILSFVR